MKEFNLTRELGRANWIDSLAGEAVVLGFASNYPELEMMGTELAIMTREIPYYDDNFSKVIAYAMHVQKEIERAINTKWKTVWIDTIYEGESLEKRNARTWEYDLLCTEGVYQILMVLPVYQGCDILENEKKLQAEIAVGKFFGNEIFETCRKEIAETNYASQLLVTASYYDNESGRLLKRVTDHNHEDGYCRGRQEIYFFEDYETAIRAWNKVKGICDIKKD